MYPGVVGIVRLQRQRFEKVVVLHVDGRRDLIRNSRIRPAEHQVLARRLEVVVENREWACAGPPRQRLRIRADLLEVGEVRGQDLQVPSVHRDPAPAPNGRVSVNVAPFEFDVVRLLRHVRFAPVTERDHIVQERSGSWSDLEAHETEVVGSGRGGENGSSGGGDRGEEMRIRGANPDAHRRELRVRRTRPNGDIPTAALQWQGKRPSVDRARREADCVTWLRLIECRLEIGTRRDINRVRGEEPLVSGRYSDGAPYDHDGAYRDRAKGPPGCGSWHQTAPCRSGPILLSSNYLSTIGRPRQRSLPENEMGISELVPQVSRPDRFRIGVTDAFDP